MYKQTVYRFLSQKEFDCWLAGDKSGISSPCHLNELPSGNMHKYKEGVKYVHFFENILDAPTILQIMDMDSDHLCKFKIDIEVLENYQGYGKYIDMDGEFALLTEYAIPLDEVDPSSLYEYRIVKNENDVKYLDDDNAGWQKLPNKEIEL